MTMEELLASSSIKSVNMSRGMEVEGVVVSILDQEIVLDIGSKSEGVISKREFSADSLKKIIPGYKLKAYVAQSENEYGQVVLTSILKSKRRGRRGAPDLTRFMIAQKQEVVLSGKIVEVNKGGFMVESGVVKGFLPNSQIGYELIKKIGEKYENGIGASIKVLVAEVDEAHERLIFSQKGLVVDTDIEMLKKVTQNKTINVFVTAILPFGLIVKFDDLEGIVYAHDTSWDKIEDLSTAFNTGQELTVMVTGFDEQFGRVNLSLKQLQEDPSIALAEKFPADDVVKGQIVSVGEMGISVALDGAEGFLPADKMNQTTTYEQGKNMTFLVDGIDSHKRRVNLAPFITSTAGLIYK